MNGKKEIHRKQKQITEIKKNETADEIKAANKIMKTIKN